MKPVDGQRAPAIGVRIRQMIGLFLNIGRANRLSGCQLRDDLIQLRSGGGTVYKGEMHHEKPACFSGSAPIDWSIDRTIASRFGASFMPPGRSMFSAKMTAPVGVFDPADPPADLRFDTRLPSGLCPQGSNRARPRRS